MYICRRWGVVDVWLVRCAEKKCDGGAGDLGTGVPSGPFPSIDAIGRRPQSLIRWSWHLRLPPVASYSTPNRLISHPFVYIQIINNTSSCAFHHSMTLFPNGVAKSEWLCVAHSRVCPNGHYTTQPCQGDKYSSRPARAMGTAAASRYGIRISL